MSELHNALADYLTMRRAFGYKMDKAERLLGQFVAFAEDRGETHVLAATALAWATRPAGAAATRALPLHPTTAAALDDYLRPAAGLGCVEAMPATVGAERAEEPLAAIVSARPRKLLAVPSSSTRKAETSSLVASSTVATRSIWRPSAGSHRCREPS